MEHNRRNIQIGDLILYKRTFFSTGEEAELVGYISSINKPFAKVMFFSPIPDGMPQKQVIYLEDDKPNWTVVS